MSDNSTPLMKQYWELKARAGDALLLFRMGDFYELFGDDAVEAARILEITLTSRNKNSPNPVPMAGVPHHSIQGYIQRLLRAGKKVAIGEQMEDPATVSGKSIVRRDITRIFTPGVQFDVEGSEANYLATAIRREDGNFILACLDSSTGEVLASDPLQASALATEIASLPIRHFLKFGEPALDLPGILVEELPTNYLSIPQAEALLKNHYGLDNLQAFVPDSSAALALGILVTYVCRTQQQEKLAHLRFPAPLHQPKTMLLGPRTVQHLDLLPTADHTPNLYQLLHQNGRIRSALGSRQLKRWLLSPLKSAAEISERQAAVRELSAIDREALCTHVAEIYDLERILGRVNTRLANPRDTLQLGRSLEALTPLAKALTALQAPLLGSLREALIRASETLGPLGRKITTEQREDAPLTVREGGIFGRGASADLDRLIDLTENGQRFLVELEAREREATGIPSLKVRYNRVFGYYIEVTQTHLKNVPAHYQRKQTTVGAERFFTEELKKFEDEIVHASVRQRSLEQEMFEALLKEVQNHTTAIMEAARVLGELDVLLALAKLGEEPGWCFPEIDESLELSITAGRHPLVDQGGTFVPNDLSLSPSTRLTLVITGPNMGGKSTVMRQNALILILGQIGAPVPAQSARWGAVSALYTRIGAHDAIARGQSTFMVEMSELAHILHYADSRSFIVLDEIGRGTSTYDGMSVAWATLEWITQKIRSRTLFATHYHELTRLSASLPGLANAHMSVASEKNGSLRFLYQLKEGPTNESFGIHVAQIAGLPKAVTSRAWKVLEELEATASVHSKDLPPPTNQLSLFDLPSEPEPAPAPMIEAAPKGGEVLEALRALNLNELTPLQALNTLAELQKSAEASFAAPIPQPLRGSSPKSSEPETSAQTQ